MRDLFQRGVLKSIPAEYRGVVHRSKLEARWHYLFHNLGFEVEYEPCVHGNWLVDFVIKGGLEEPILVEVKPLSDFQIMKDQLELGVRESLGEHAVLVVGDGSGVRKFPEDPAGWAPAIGPFYTPKRHRFFTEPVECTSSGHFMQHRYSDEYDVFTLDEWYAANGNQWLSCSWEEIWRESKKHF